MREIILDTETTGFDPAEGDRIVEIGCVEMMNGIPTGATYHQYINPERAMPQAAFNVHGLSDAFLADKPVFADIADAFLAFVGEARLVIHNAAFDMKFLNAELGRLKRRLLPLDRVVDTVAMARRKHPGARAGLDELCSRYGIDRSRRVKHGALLDAELLAEVYIELTGGRQTALGLRAEGSRSDGIVRREGPTARPSPLARLLTAAEEEAHAAFVAGLGDQAVWNRYSG